MNREQVLAGLEAIRAALQDDGDFEKAQALFEIKPKPTEEKPTSPKNSSWAPHAEHCLHGTDSE